MKIGDLVIKNKGRDSRQIGIIIKIADNAYIGETVKIVSVYDAGQIKNWYSNYVEVLSEK